ncbi:MAG: DNA-processing protein DprA, partial [Vulcanimicrobiaceae bacterium]
AAHAGEIDAGAPTIGVLGGGHLRFFPRRNRELAERICAAGGAVASPYAPDQHALPAQFLARNAVVAGLSDAVVVVEAPARSGALNTAGHAAGRIPVLAVPGDLDRRSVEGCHALIRDGATLARSASDVLEAMGMLRTGKPPRGREAALPARGDPLQRTVLRTLDAGETTLDALASATSAPAGAILAALAVLEFDGAVESRPGNRYALARQRREGS